MRGMWVDAFGEGIRDEREVAELVEWACRAGLDSLVVQIGRRGDALANDLPLPRAETDLAPLPFDPLAAVCERAHASGLAVHAWLGATPIAQRGGPAPRFVPWLSQREDGATTDRHGVVHLDPGHPEARSFVAGCAAAVADRYPVDGVNLDRVRYPESAGRGRADWGYNDDALARYAAETGDGHRPHPEDPTWQAWRRDQVTAMVAETAASVRAARKEVVVSTTGTCFGGLERGWEASRPWIECGQDWPGWLRGALVDHVLVMDYRGDADDADLVSDVPADADLDAEGAVAMLVDPAVLRARFDAWAELAVTAGGARAVLGTGLYLQDTDRNLTDIAHALAVDVGARAAGGWCGYSYRTPSRLVLHGERSAADEREHLAVGLQAIWAPASLPASDG
jgi:uncharacterized lipoprotein YddW (UPF0748 family)